MTEQTKKGEKFTKARLFLKANPRIASRLINWQKMHGATLYKALSLSGIVWDIEAKCWRETQKAHSEAPALLKVAPTRKEGVDLTVQVRIIADEKVINTALANLLELAGALDWTLTRNSGVRKGHYGSGRLVYLKFTLPRS